MDESDLQLLALYDWVCRNEDDMQDLAACFDANLKVDRSRLIMGFRCLRVTLELRVHSRFPQRLRTAPNGTEPQAPSRRLPL